LGSFWVFKGNQSKKKAFGDYPALYGLPKAYGNKLEKNRTRHMPFVKKDVLVQDFGLGLS